RLSLQRPLRPVVVITLQPRSSCAQSVRRSSADWRDVTPEQDALLHQHTIQPERRKKVKLDQEGLLAEQRHLDGVCTHRNFIQAFVWGMLAR
ncbi:unnamed protein product, partial [Menidia menidia]